MESEFTEKVIHINRVANSSKAAAASRSARSSSLATRKSRGRGRGKANEVPEAIRKGTERATKAMVEIPLVDGTIPHQIIGHFGSGRVLLKPAGAGTGVIAGGPVRAVVECAGISNILTKSLGSNTPHNMVYATMEGLKSLQSAQHVAAKRGIAVEEL